jgi:hypothetical protein
MQEQFLNREQAQKILDTRPPGTNVNDALSELAKQGFKIEGYNDKNLIEKGVNLGRDIAGMITQAPENVVRTATAPLAAAGKSLVKGTSFQSEYSDVLNKLADPNRPSLTNIISGGQEQATGRNLNEPSKIAGDVLQSVPILKGGALAKGIYGAGAKVGAETLGKMAAGILPAYMIDTGMNLSKGEDLSQAAVPGLTTAIGGLPGLAPLVQGAGRVAQKAGAELAGAVLPVTEKEAGVVQAYMADKPFVQRMTDILKDTSKAPTTAGGTAVSNSLFGNKSMIGVQAKRAENKIWNNIINPLLESSTYKVDMPEFFNTINTKIDETVSDASRKIALKEALSAIKDDYAGVTTKTMPELQKLKEDWAEFIPEKYYKGQNIAGAVKQVTALMADEARNTLYTVLGPEAKQAYFDYGNLKGLAKMGQTNMTGQKLKGGTGGLVSELISKAVTPIGTIGGNVIYRTGQGIEFVGDAGAKILDDILGIGKNQVLSKPASMEANQTTANTTKNVNINKVNTTSAEKASKK